MAAATAASPTRLVPSKTSPKCKSILLNGQNSPQMQDASFLRPLGSSQKSATTVDSNRPLSPALSTGMSSSEEDSTRPLTPATPSKLTFATPLPSSGKRRANSITLGVSARAQMLQAQNAGQAPPPRTAPVQPNTAGSPWYAGGMVPPDVYTVSDAKAGMKKAWSKIRRSRSTSRDSRASSTSSHSIPEEPAEGEEMSVGGERTPRARNEPGVDANDLGNLVRRASADPKRPNADSQRSAAVFGYDTDATRAPLPARASIHDHDTEYWRSKPPVAADDDSSVSGSGDESRESRDEDDEEEEEDIHLAEMRKTSTAASIEVVERQKR